MERLLIEIRGRALEILEEHANVSLVSQETAWDVYKIVVCPVWLNAQICGRKLHNCKVRFENESDEEKARENDIG